MPRERILLVEDEAIIAMTESAMLSSRGFHVETAHSGDAAVEKAREDPIDLVLMDIDLGPNRIDGTEAAQRILAFADIPIVFLTSHTEQKMVERVKGITRYGYVVKHSGEFVLVEAIEMALELHRAHRRLRESEEKYRAAFMTSPDAVNINRLDGLYVDINEGFTNLTGFTREDVIGRTSGEIEIWAIPEDRERLVEGLQRDGVVSNLESTFRCKDGTHKSALMSARIIRLRGTSHILSITRDITDRISIVQRLKASEERFRLAVEGSRDGLWDWDTRTNYAYHSDRFATMLGYEPDELPYTSEAWSELIHPDDIEDAMASVQRYLAGETEVYESVFRMRRKDGEYRWINGRGKAVFDEEGRPTRFIGFNTDITAQKEQAARVERLVSEKDDLLREINHRVKNNLLMVASLLRFKQDSVGDEVDLSDVAHQIDAIRIVHETLYTTGNYATVELGEYLEQLVEAVCSSFDVGAVNVAVNVEDIAVSVKDAISIGLIVNELATNAVKHAFLEGYDRRFTLKISKNKTSETDAGSIQIRVGNSGAPFPDTVDFASAETIGLQLIRALVAQLEGEATLTRSPETVVTIRIPFLDG